MDEQHLKLFPWLLVGLLEESGLLKQEFQQSQRVWSGCKITLASFYS